MPFPAIQMNKYAILTTEIKNIGCPIKIWEIYRVQTMTISSNAVFTFEYNAVIKAIYTNSLDETTFTKYHTTHAKHSFGKINIFCEQIFQ